jgi:Endonuclease NucS
VLPEAVRLLILRADGSVLVHDDADGYKPLNWMTGPTFIEELGDRLVVRKPKTEDVLEIRLAEVLSDVTHDMGESAALQKDGVERDSEAFPLRVERGSNIALSPGHGPVSGGQVKLAGRGLVQANGSSNEGRESLLIDFIVLVEVDCAPGVAFEA